MQICIFGIALLWLHRFSEVELSPASRKTSTILQQKLKRNQTILAGTFNSTPLFYDKRKRSKIKGVPVEDNTNSGLNPFLIDATPTNTRKVMLFSRNLHLLQISNSGLVNGTSDETIPNGK